MKLSTRGLFPAMLIALLPIACVSPAYSTYGWGSGAPSVYYYDYGLYPPPFYGYYAPYPYSAPYVQHAPHAHYYAPHAHGYGHYGHYGHAGVVPHGHYAGRGFQHAPHYAHR